MLCDDAVKGLDVFERATHQERIVDTLAVIRKDSNVCPRIRHRPDLRECDPSESFGDRADGSHCGVAVVESQRLNLLDNPSRVLNGHGVSHREYGGESTHRRGTSARQNRLALLEPGFAQMSVQIDEARKCLQAARIDGAISGCCLRENTTIDREVGPLSARQSGIDDSDTHESPLLWISSR